ncbi:MAG: permease of phosphate ABC transporter [Candidatus Heteroscillospira sp.]|jgi:hypothetical protein
MKRLFDSANRYCMESDWKVLAMLKFCLASMGVLIGISLPDRAKKTAAIVASAVFIITYIPLILKYFDVFNKSEK